MEPAVKIVLLLAYTMCDFEGTRFAWLQIGRETRSLAEASPQQVEFLLAAVR